MRWTWLGIAALSASAATATTLTHERNASANGFEYPELGTEVMGRAGAWTARADTPLAMSLNPAGLAGQRTAFSITTNLAWQSMCFQRAGVYPNQNHPSAVSDPTEANYAGEAFPETCKDNGAKNVNVVPQIIFVYQVSPKLSISGGVVSPNAAGKANWSDTVTTAGGNTAPSPGRYLLLSQDNIIIYPTLAAGYEVAPGVRIGAAFQAVMAFLKFSNVAQAAYLGNEPSIENPEFDLKADLSIKKLFTPALVLGALISPSSSFDVGMMFRWSADIHATSGDVHVTGPYPGNPAKPGKVPSPTDANITEFNIAQPWDLKVGFRYHQAREGATSATGAARDPMSMDQFDIELDLTYSHNSSLDKIGIMFPAGTGVSLGGTTAGSIPQDASVPHQWKDVYGVRLGGEYVAVPNQLAIRAGAYFQTSGVDAANLALDFSPSQQFGLFAGATYRATQSIDLSLGLGHVFYTKLDNGGNGTAYGLLSEEAAQTQSFCSGKDAGKSTGLGTSGTGYHMCGPANGGSLTQSLNVLSLGFLKRF